jgi:beta-N-acetylhexosaminidase
MPISSEDEKAITEADKIILATRNANLSPYQKDFGLSLGKKHGTKLIVIATCDPYDFLEEEAEIKNYITIYEPTIPAFKSAVDVIFGVIKATGTLPVGHRQITNNFELIRLFDGSEHEIDHIWTLWAKIFRTWAIDRERLVRILGMNGRHLVHEHGFCLSFVSGGQAKIAAIGVLPEHRGKGIGTSLINKAVHQLQPSSSLPLSIGSNFPRVWPGVPVNFPAEAKNFFLHRGISSFLSP